MRYFRGVLKTTDRINRATSGISGSATCGYARRKRRDMLGVGHIRIWPRSTLQSSAVVR